MNNQPAKHLFKSFKPGIIPLLFITALHQEAIPLFERIAMTRIKKDSGFTLFRRDAFPVFLLETGPGPLHTHTRLTTIFKDLSPLLVINFGICGALDDNIPLYKAYSIKSVQILGSTEKLVTELPRIIPRSLLDRFPPRNLLTVHRPVLNKAERETLLKTTDCHLVDMESYSILKAAAAYSIPCLLLKLVSDHADKNSLSRVKTNKKHWQKHIGHMLDFLLQLLEK